MEKNNYDEYTVVLDGSYVKPNTQDLRAHAEELRSYLPEDREEKNTEPEKPQINEKMDRLYYDYERMCLKQPGIIDKDDAYPHSYYWRLGDRYDPGKVAALEEALKSGGKIENTEAYEKYVEEVKGRKYSPVSWD
jgi:hypothetical protein